MSIIVNTHNPQEEEALLAFLDKMKFDYVQADDEFTLTAEQQQEILERDRQYEAGEMDWFDGLSDEQQASVKRGLGQADKGETISHDEAIARLGL